MPNAAVSTLEVATNVRSSSDFDPMMRTSSSEDGSDAPDVGRLIIYNIKSLADVRASEELETRIAALEEARDARA